MTHADTQVRAADGHAATNAGEMMQHVKDDTVSLARAAGGEAQHQYAGMKNYANQSLESIEKEVQTKPVQSVAIAFAAGALISLLFSRR